MVTYLVIFGAAVKPDGTPSGTLLRSVEGALRASEDAPGCVFLGTGRVGRHGPAEGAAIVALLAARGVLQSRILVEREAGDTLESALYCHEILRHHSRLGHYLLEQLPQRALCGALAPAGSPSADPDDARRPASPRMAQVERICPQGAARPPV